MKISSEVFTVTASRAEWTHMRGFGPMCLSAPFTVIIKWWSIFRADEWIPLLDFPSRVINAEAYWRCVWRSSSRWDSLWGFFPSFYSSPVCIILCVCVCVLILIMAFKSCSNGFPQRNGAEGDLAVIAHERPFHFLFLPFLLSFSYSPPWSFNTFSQIDVSTAAVINLWKYRQQKCSLQLLWRDTCAVQVAQAHVIASTRTNTQVYDQNNGKPNKKADFSLCGVPTILLYM